MNRLLHFVLLVSFLVSSSVGFSAARDKSKKISEKDYFFIENEAITETDVFNKIRQNYADALIASGIHETDKLNDDLVLLIALATMDIVTSTTHMIVSRFGVDFYDSKSLILANGLAANTAIYSAPPHVWENPRKTLLWCVVDELRKNLKDQVKDVNKSLSKTNKDMKKQKMSLIVLKLTLSHYANHPEFIKSIVTRVVQNIYEQLPTEDERRNFKIHSFEHTKENYKELQFVKTTKNTSVNEKIQVIKSLFSIFSLDLTDDINSNIEVQSAEEKAIFRTLRAYISHKNLF